MDWYLKVIKNYAGFEGRARRTEYWMFALISVGISIVLTIVESVIGLPGILSGLYALAIIIPSIAVGARRLHDIGKSGWWQLIGLIPLIGIIVLIVFYAKEGDQGPNAFGADPKAV